MRELLRRGEFVVTAEMTPPMGADVGMVRRKAGYFKGAVDAVNVTDCASAVVRASSWACCAMLMEEGLEPVLQMACRDRNRIALQADAMGAALLGIVNVLAVTGDFVMHGTQPDAMPVFDLDSVNLIQALRMMRDEGRILSGEEIKPRPDFFIGCAANPSIEPPETQVWKLTKKAEAGAEFVQTQAVFDLKRFERFMKLVYKEGLHERLYFLVGVIPMRSPRAAKYMRDEVPGMVVPDELVRRMERAEDPKEEGVKIAVEIINEVRQFEGVRGIHLMPVMWESITPRVVEEAGLLPRPG